MKLFEGDIKIPGLGPVKKQIVIPIAAGAAAFIGWRYYMAGSMASTGEEDPAAATDGEYGAEDVLPSVAGAVKEDNSYGYSDTEQDTGTSTITTNDAWARYAANELQSGGRSYDTVIDALGAYLARKPLTSAQQSIVQAALAAAGQPPVGTYSLVPGGNVSLTVAPAGLKATATSSTSVTLTFSAVPGAAGYRAFKDGAGANRGSSVGTTMIIGDLEPNTSYRFNVKPITASGAYGPASGMVSVKTKPVTLKAPNKPTVSRVTKSTAHASTSRVANADGYNWFLNGQTRGHTDAPSWDMAGLKAGTRYTVTVKADTSSGAPGPASTGTAFTTKRK